MLTAPRFTERPSLGPRALRIPHNLTQDALGDFVQTGKAQTFSHSLTVLSPYKLTLLAKVEDFRAKDLHGGGGSIS